MKCLFFAAAFVIASCAAPQQPRPANAATLAAQAQAAVEARRAELIAFRRDLHQHPEVSGQEERTARLIGERLQALGYEVRRNVGGHGVVATLRGPRPGPAVAFRADMDAVRSEAPDPVDFASLNPGVRHICGHDIHAAIGMALAEGFAAIRSDLAGTVVIIFQPAEEDATGARAMLADGAFVSRPDAIYAVHTSPYEVGQLAVREGVQMAARDRLEIEVRGPGAAAAMEALHARLVALSTAEAFAGQPAASDFINVGGGAVRQRDGALTANVQFNVATAAASAHARAATERAIADTLAEHRGAEIVTRYQSGWIPGVRNDPALTRAAVDSVRSELGAPAVNEVQNIIPAFSEDFGHFQAQTPGVMFFLGVSNEARGWVGMPHTPDYVADEESIFVGARAMSRAMLERMQAG